MMIATGCFENFAIFGKTKIIEESRVVIPFQKGTIINGKEIPFQGVAIPDSAYDYMKRCQDYIDSRGIIP